ncbi:unnamed protein product [Lactuca saligna]|uniref:Uncharacterized protein n=1 Tax=Lactuca saligna TaxID=75948 RepID=A0AA35V621_LACSI|nr:unnamed protein product [Lactuca saligna]
MVGSLGCQRVSMSPPSTIRQLEGERISPSVRFLHRSCNPKTKGTAVCRAQQNDASEVLGVTFDCLHQSFKSSGFGCGGENLEGLKHRFLESNPGHPFAIGLTLAKLAAFTVDEKGNETFDTSGALDKLRKSLQLERLAMYHDSSQPPWMVDKKWEDLSPKDWVEIFEDGINEPAKGHAVSAWARDRHYLVSL